MEILRLLLTDNMHALEMTLFKVDGFCVVDSVGGCIEQKPQTSEVNLVCSVFKKCDTSRWATKLLLWPGTVLGEGCSWYWSFNHSSPWQPWRDQVEDIVSKWGGLSSLLNYAPTLLSSDGRSWSTLWWWRDVQIILKSGWTLPSGFFSPGWWCWSAWPKASEPVARSSKSL